MGGSRMKDEADFDLERFIEMFDTAMTSDDARVVNALRQLMMMVVLTSSTEQLHSRHSGPLRRMYDDVYNLNQRIGRIEEELNQIRYRDSYKDKTWHGVQSYYDKASVQMAKDIDEDIMRQMAKQINTSVALPKGLFKK